MVRQRRDEHNGRQTWTTTRSRCCGRDTPRGDCCAPLAEADAHYWGDLDTHGFAILDRLRRAGGDLVLTADHIGSTSVPGLLAKDVLDLQLGVADLAAADRLAPALAAAGFPRVQGQWRDRPKEGIAEPGARWEKRFHANADPARAVNLHVRVAGGPGWTYALACRDWLRTDASARAGYQQVKEHLVATTGSTRDYAAAKEPWFDQAWPQIQTWAERTGWAPPQP